MDPASFQAGVKAGEQRTRDQLKALVEPGAEDDTGVDRRGGKR